VRIREQGQETPATPHPAQRKCPPPRKATGISALFEVSLLLVAALVTGLAKQLAVLLLGHTLATLLNN
jgi:hypothetical protein